MSTELLFVYGSLLHDTGIRAIDRILNRHVRLLGPASVAGRLYDLGPYPGAVTTGPSRTPIHGRLLELQQAQRWLPVLDRYEGYLPDNRGHCEYVRERVDARLKNKRQTLTCWMYVYGGPTTHRRRLRSGRDRQR